MHDDDALVAALKQRDMTALATLFERYSDPIYRLAVSLLHDEQQADGVVQETFLRLIAHVQRFEGRSSISTWLYRVGYNECMMRLRRAPLTVALDADEDGEIMPAHFADWEHLPESLISGQEAAAQLDRAIAALKPDMRAVFTLRDVDELSTHETAAILGISENLVKVRLHRARLALREMLAAYFEERAR